MAKSECRTASKINIKFTIKAILQVSGERESKRESERGERERARAREREREREQEQNKDITTSTILNYLNVSNLSCRHEVATLFIHMHIVTT